MCNSLLGLATLLLAFTASAAPAVVCQIITPAADGLIASRRVDEIARRTAGAIVDKAALQRVPISDALDACRTSDSIDRCVLGVLHANRAALAADLRDSAHAGYLFLTARVSDKGIIEGMAIFVQPDGTDTGVTYQLQPLDVHQRPRRHIDEQRRRPEWFAPDSTYLLQSAACDVAYRLGLAASEKHVKIRAFDHQNGFDDGTIDWSGAAIIR